MSKEARGPQQSDRNTSDPPPSTETPDDHISSGGEAGIIIGILIVLALVAFLAWFLYTRLRARRLGIPPPPLNPFVDSNRIPGSGSGGVVGWVRDKIGAAQRKRTAGGAYEGDSLGGGGGFGSRSLGGRRSQRTFGGLDPDEAWDARVGEEADGYGYEEQELSLRDLPAHRHGDENEETGYGGSRYGRVGGAGDLEAGRGMRNELDERYDEEIGRKGPSRNPFEEAEPSNISLREVSPIRHSDESTRTVERKSAFREAV